MKPFHVSWHYLLLWIIVAGMIAFKITAIFKPRLAPHTHAVMICWTPSDTVKYAPAFAGLHKILIRQTGGWSRTKMNGAWHDEQTDRVYAEDGFLYVISLFTADARDAEKFRKEIDDLVTGPENNPGFGQKESYIEFLSTSRMGIYTPLFE